MNADDIGRILDELGDRLGPAGSHVFGLAVRQAIIEGAASLIAGIALTVVAVWAFNRGRAAIFRKREKSEGSYYSSSDDSMERYFTMGLMSAGLGVVFIFGMWTLYDGVTSLLNPEYAAIRDLLNRLVPQ